MGAPARSADGRKDAGPGRLLPLVIVVMLAAAGGLLVWTIVVGGEHAAVSAAVLALLGVAGVIEVTRLRRAVRGERGRTAVFESIAALTDPALMRLAADELVGVLVERTHAAIHPDLAGVALLDEVGDELAVIELRGARGVEPAFVVRRRASGLLASVVDDARSVLADDTTGGQVAAELAHRPLRSFAGCPLQIDGRVMGVAFLTSSRPNAFDLDDLRLLQRVADRVALALEREMRTTIDLPADLHDALRSIARDRGTTLSDVVVGLVRRGLGQSPGPLVGRSARTGLAVIQVGRPVTQDDVRSLDDGG